MADKKISALPASTTPLAGSEVLPIVQSGSTTKVSVANLTAGRTVSATGYTATAGNVVVAENYGISFGIGSTYLYGSTTNGYIRLDVNNATAFGVDSSRNATVNVGNLIIGTAGKGIDFSANGGDVLSQYDEGTWAISDISGAGLSLTVDHAKYTRVGNLVTINVYVTYPVTANTANATLSLPSALAASKFDIGTAGATSGNAAYAITVGGTNAMTVRNSSITTLTNANLSGAGLLISITYMV